MIRRIVRMVKTERRKGSKKPVIVLLFHRLKKKILLEIHHLKLRVTKNGTFSSDKDLWMCSLFPQKVLDLIIRELNPKSVLDVGCGCGVSLAYFIKNGIDAVGLENSSIAIEKAFYKEKIIKHNLNKEFYIDRNFDLVWCFEVIEHIHPDFELCFLKTVTNKSPVIILSAARPGQGGHGHFNEQSPEYWIAKFELLGYHFDETFSMKLRATNDMHAENILCFKK